MHTITLPVLDKHRAVYGDSVTVSPVMALALSRKGVVNLSTPALETRDLVPEQPVEEVPRRRRRYRRRDLTAEN